MGSIRDMTRNDLTAVADIEFESFESPWTLEDVRAEWRDRGVRSQVFVDCRLVVGYIFWEWGNSARDVAEIINLAVIDNRRREGIASKLIDSIVKRKPSMRISAITSERNALAHAFLSAVGFEAQGVKVAPYGGFSGDDGYVFVKRIGRN